jgi:hypothetical protein
MAHTLTIEVSQQVYDSLIVTAKEIGASPEAVAAQWLGATSQRITSDPLDEIIGTLHSDIADWGERHDYYIGMAALETAPSASSTSQLRATSPPPGMLLQLPCRIISSASLISSKRCARRV